MNAFEVVHNNPRGNNFKTTFMLILLADAQISFRIRLRIQTYFSRFLLLYMLKLL